MIMIISSNVKARLKASSTILIRKKSERHDIIIIYLADYRRKKKEMSDVNVRMIENVCTCDVDALEVKARSAGFCIGSDIWMCLLLPTIQAIAACYLKYLCFLSRARLAVLRLLFFFLPNDLILVHSSDNPFD